MGCGRDMAGTGYWERGSPFSAEAGSSPGGSWGGGPMWGWWFTTRGLLLYSRGLSSPRIWRSSSSAIITWNRIPTQCWKTEGCLNMQHLLFTCATTSTAIYSVSEFQGLTRPVNHTLPFTIPGTHKASKPCPPLHNFRDPQGQWTLSFPSGTHKASEPCPPLHNSRDSQGQWTLSSPSGAHKASKPCPPLQGLTRSVNPPLPFRISGFTRSVNPALPITISGAHKASEPCPPLQDFRDSQGQWTLSSSSQFQELARPVNPVLPFRISRTHKASEPYPPLEDFRASQGQWTLPPPSQFQGFARPVNPVLPSGFQGLTRPANPALPITISGAHKASEPCPPHHNFRCSQGQWTLSPPSGFQGLTRPVNPALPFRISGTHKTSRPPAPTCKMCTSTYLRFAAPRQHLALDLLQRVCLREGHRGLGGKREVPCGHGGLHTLQQCSKTVKTCCTPFSIIQCVWVPVCVCMHLEQSLWTKFCAL